MKPKIPTHSLLYKNTAADAPAQVTSQQHASPNLSAPPVVHLTTNSKNCQRQILLLAKLRRLTPRLPAPMPYKRLETPRIPQEIAPVTLEKPHTPQTQKSSLISLPSHNERHPYFPRNSSRNHSTSNPLSLRIQLLRKKRRGQ